MRKLPSKKTSSLKGYLLFFITIAVTVTIALTLFTLIYEKTNGDKLIIAISMLVIIIGMTTVCTGLDILRRKLMIDRPVSKILSATEKIASGDFSVRLSTLHSYEKYDDYDIIMENLNAMAAELEKSEILKTGFISDISHEIRTPLAIIQNYVHSLQNETDETTRKQYTETIISACKRLNNLISNILVLNKLENQTLSIAHETVKLHDSITDAILRYEEIIEKKELEIECNLTEMEIISSSSLLEIIWNNLLSNAIKFTENKGKISINLKPTQKGAVIEISDTGCGISPEIGARIFDKFFQVDPSRLQEGNGLGLALVKRVIDLLGGEISVSSVIEHGSTFTITLKGLI